MSPDSNKLLAALPRADFELLVSQCALTSMPRGTVIYEPDDDIEQVYFPLSGMISLVMVMKNGKAVETATIGREGVFGAIAAFGNHRSQCRAVVQHSMDAARIATPAFRKLATRPAIIDLAARYDQMLLSQVQITAACNALHAVEARLSRWLLQTSDRTQSEIIELTQEFLSEMLGVRRTSVTEVAGKLQALGLIRYSRGAIRIADRDGLRALACECYDLIRALSPP